MNFLSTILAHKKEEVSRRQRTVPLDALKHGKYYLDTPRSLEISLSGKPMAVIAELKKASPSKNLIRENFDPFTLARELAAAGASALSVVTDERFFQGDLGSLSLLRPHVSIPLLRKDFIIDEYQVHEAKAAGADAILLILAALDRRRFASLMNAAGQLGLGVLVEVHRESELEIVDGVPLTMVGINARDLETFETDPTTMRRVRGAVPPGTLLVAESGIRTSTDLLELARTGIHAALIGETLMRARSPGGALAELLAPLQGEKWSG